MTKKSSCPGCEPFIIEHFNCECHHPEHAFSLTFDKEEGDLYLNIFLSPRIKWYKRIIPAIKYILGYKSKFGHFDEVQIDPHKRAQLFEIVNKFKQYHD
jgi:hypothetical protein